jgi:hypothetical protein
LVEQESPAGNGVEIKARSTGFDKKKTGVLGVYDKLAKSCPIRHKMRRKEESYNADESGSTIFRGDIRII